MGGIPFRSTGCNTCRRRKVKCDEAKPQCNRCIKNGHVCTGYERKRVFIHQSSGAIEGIQQQQQLVRRPKSTPEHGSAKITDRQITRVEPEIPRWNINVEVRSQLLTSFIESYLPPSEYLRDGSGKNLLETLPQLSGGSPLLDRAITSLSSAFLAKQNKDDRLLRYSIRLYNNSMGIMHRLIGSDKRPGQDVLYTTVIFQLYELIHSSPPGFMAWIWHVQGSNVIMDQCTGHRDETVAEKLFYRQLKFVTLCDAVGKRKAATLYNTLNWQNRSPQAKLDPVDEVADNLAECSALIERIDAFIDHAIANPGTDKQAGEQLLSCCLTLEQKLHRTCIEVQRKLGMPSVLPPDTPSREGFRAHLTTGLFPEPLGFASLTCAESHLIYWATLILLYPLVDQLLDVLGRPQTDVTSFPPSCATRGPTDPNNPLASVVATDFTALAEHYADEVCRSVMYCTQPAMKTLGAQILLAPFSQCTQFFQVQGLALKYRWCQGVFMHLGSLGLGIAPLLKDMVWPQYRSAQQRSVSPVEEVP
ncbi:hypothetical protein BO70DRAFT_396132 [Aspergillus heteromorphus CBS 117.55]|uniref:Zn(2)-C6 fungal-type domain-containing protein n=1 Tax=Aspergillus heteromorphus CBS 117.55 TaxID=1448321 RepID=A0A317WCX6_9EURO|nr:uncharacterized protein BO70DRAFT_396132 [Aspergillus heteromorphus CBS 117.55]PWY82888.1 hypothetical protein BO70DRAFT_396132 [Aspergillus heteromorphus CBS 117.55]